MLRASPTGPLDTRQPRPSPAGTNVDFLESMDHPEVCVWHAELNPSPDTISGLHDLLADDERHRLSHIRLERDRRRFIVAHGALRDLLGQYLGIHPRQIRFGRSTSGKPALHPDSGSQLAFNLAHSADLALIAIASGADVGVDVEHVSFETDGLDVARHWFSAAEAHALDAMPDRQRTHAFYDLWTRREAWAKARGDGLAMPEAILSAGPGREWSVFPLRPAPGYVGALAIRGSGWQLRERRWEAGVPSGNTVVP